MTTPKFDIRSFSCPNLRVETRNDQRVVIGRAVGFNSMSLDLGGFREVIRPGAFTATLSDGHDVKALIDHNRSWVIGSTRAGTLRLVQGDDGLDFEGVLPNTTFANDLAENLRLGNVSECSFGFITTADQIRSDEQGPIVEVLAAELHEISLGVAFPAYPQVTTVALRSVEAWRQQQAEPKGTPILDRAKRLLQLELSA